jgi:ComEC/Rec2-related protein
MRKALQRWLAACPLMALAAAGAVGIMLADFDVAVIRIWAFPAALLLLTASLVVPVRWLLFIACGMAFAALHVAQLERSFEHPLRLHLLDAGSSMPAVLEGRLMPDHASSTAASTRAICEASLVTLEDGSRWPMRTRLRIMIPSDNAFPGPGTYRISGLLRLPSGQHAPGTFDPADHALRSGFAAEMRASTVEKVSDEGAAWTCAMLDAAEESRRWISEQLTLDINDDPRHSGVIRAMALGVADEAQDDIEDAFRDSGTLHVFAVSGLHVAMLGMIAWQVLKLLRLGRGVSLVVMVLIVFAYAFITGWRPSAARAALMVAVVFCGPSVDRDSGVQNNLGLASLLLLGMDTQQLFMPGFQLSFGVLWSIAALTGVFMSPMARWMSLDPFLPVEFATWRHRLALGLRRWLIGNACVSASAWLGSLPFILLHFQAVTPVALIANSVLVPLSIAALAITCLSVLAALVKLTGLQIAINNANWLVAKAMVASAAWFSSLPGANFHFNPPPAGADATAITWRVLPVTSGGAANHLHVHEKDWLLDTGPAEDFRWLLHPYLRHEGINRLGGIILSHNDADHIGAVEEVLGTFGHPELFCSAREPGPYDSRQTIIRRLESRMDLKKLTAGDALSLSSEASLHCLHPSATSRSMRGDDRAMVLMARLHGWRLLWMSDAGWITEQALRESGQDLRCDVLLTSGHETDASGTEDFLQAAQPRLVIRGSRGFTREAKTAPKDTLAAWCAREGVPLLQTTEAGSALITVEPGELRCRPENGRAITLEAR